MNAERGPEKEIDEILRREQIFVYLAHFSYYLTINRMKNKFSEQSHSTQETAEMTCHLKF